MKIMHSKINFSYSLIVVYIFLISCQKSRELLPPNVVMIIADDLGWSQLGCYGSSFYKTPNIDKLAKEGMILTNHYSGSPVCAPARAVLLTGLHSGKNPVRGNDEWKERGDVWSFEAMFDNPELEGQRPLPD